jgi:hypothetical protein
MLYDYLRALFVGDVVRYRTQLSMYDYKGIWEKAAGVTKAYMANDETFRCIFNGHYNGFTHSLGVYTLEFIKTSSYCICYFIYFLTYL